MFWRFQQTSLILTLRSNVTQQRLKNLQQQRVHLNVVISWVVLFHSMFFFFKKLGVILNWPALWVWVRQANTQKARVSPAKLWEKNKHWVYISVSQCSGAIYTSSYGQLTAMISALEMVGAMLLMNREQVRWRGRGLGESSLGFVSSFFSSSEFSFCFSSEPAYGKKKIIDEYYDLWLLGTWTMLNSHWK